MCPLPKPDKDSELLPFKGAIYFDGVTYMPSMDRERLGKQLKTVLEFMRAANGWNTLEDISRAIGAPQASVSARLRDLRKKRFGSFNVERRRRGDGGLFEYKLSSKEVPTA